ncbi:hypothetical protein SAMN05428947_109191 [Mucilaginibacter sp. OK283]|jgi:hypothetical protein|nr:hypothetical protein SAMN05428947_109191 [Mucilaginibacter sp. OK283]
MYMPFLVRQNRPKNKVRFFFKCFATGFFKRPFNAVFAIFNAKKREKSQKLHDLIQISCKKLQKNTTFIQLLFNGMLPEERELF